MRIESAVTGAGRSLSSHNQSDPASYKIPNTDAIKATAARIKSFIFLQFENIWYLSAKFLIQIQNSTLKRGENEVSHSITAFLAMPVPFPTADGTENTQI